MADLYVQVQNALALFFAEALFLEREEAGWRAERFAVVEYGQVLNVQAEAAPGRLHVHDDRDGAAFDAFTEAYTASAGEARVCESLQHARIISLGAVSAWPPSGGRPGLYSRALISRSNCDFVAIPECFLAILPSRPMITDTGMPKSGPKASCTSSRPLPTSSG